MRKPTRILAIAMLICMIFSSAAMAAVPNNSVIVGGQAYDLTYLETNTAAQTAVVNGIATAYVVIGGNVLLATDGAAATAAQIAAIPQVTYTSPTGTQIFAAGNGADITNVVTVNSIAAVNSTTLGVTLNRELTATEKTAATFAFTLAGNPITMSAVTWDGAVAKVTRADAAKLTAGTYGVTVNGLGTAALTKTGDVAAEAAATLTISTERVRAAVTQALAYTVKDQYGDSMTVAPAAITVQAYNTTAPARAAVITSISNISFAACNVGDTVKITAYLTANPAITVVKDITVTNIALGSITLGEPTLPAGTTRFTTGTAGVIIPVTAKDNFNGATALTAEAWATTVATTDGLVPTFTAASFGAVAVNAAGNLAVTLGNPGTATLTITNPATGDVIVKTITVVAAADTATITMTAPTALVRMGATSPIPFTLTNQFGEAMTVASAGWATADVSLSSTNVGVATVAWVGNVITVTPVAAGTTTIFATVVTPVANAATAVNSLPITVNVAKAPTTITVSGTPKVSLAQGETVAAAATTGALKFAITDQDGAAINPGAAGAAGIKVDVSITNNPAGVLAAPVASHLDAADMGAVGTTNGITVTAGAVNGTASVTAQLYNDANNNDTMDAGEAIGSPVTVTYTVAAPVLTRGAITGITVLTANADFSAAQGALTSASVLTYALQDQAGNALTTTTATSVNWTITNTGANSITVNDGAAKTLAAGATATYTTSAAAAAGATTTLTITSANEDKVNVSVAAAGVAAPATTSLYYTANVMAASQTFNGTVVAFDKTANWLAVQTSIGYVVVDYADAATFTGTIGYTVDGNTAVIAPFETALTIGDTVTCTSNATPDLTVALTNK